MRSSAYHHAEIEVLQSATWKILPSKILPRLDSVRLVGTMKQLVGWSVELMMRRKV